MRPSQPNPVSYRAATLCVLLALLACPASPPIEMNAAERAEYCRLSLERARAQRAEGNLVAAERTLRGVLVVDPRHQRARLLRIEVLEQLGRTEEANRERQLARLGGAGREGLPQEPVDAPSQDVVVIVAGPEVAASRALAYASAMTDPIAAVLVERVGVRLPNSELTRKIPASVPEAQAWLDQRRPRAAIAVRGRNAFCGSSQKDGRFAVAELDVVVARSGHTDPEQLAVRETRYDVGGLDCKREAMAWGLEKALGRVELRRALEEPSPVSPVVWPRTAARALFLALDAAIERSLTTGRDAMARGQFEEALQAFREAERLDPEDPEVLALVREAEATLALQRDLRGAVGRFRADLEAQARGRAGAPGRSLRALLVEEGGPRHDELLAALGHAGVAPSHPESLAALPPPTDGEDEVGARLARALAGDPRVARAPGDPPDLLYFPPGSTAPVLHARDLDGDERLDTWIGYSNGTRSQVWADGDGDGAPDLHVIFRPGGNSIDRIEIDDDGDGRPERILAYANGRLTSRAWDSNGDGVLDRFERLDGPSSGLGGEDLERLGGAPAERVVSRGSLSPPAD